jgi:solute carrier family 8 (sodium/calcium exchanger)
VRPGSLAFSVTVFCVGAVVAILSLLLRRRKSIAGGELGGQRLFKKLFTFLLVTLWLVYLVLSGLEIYGIIKGF